MDEFAEKSIIIVDFDGTIVHLETDWQSLRNNLEGYCFEKFNVRQSFTRLDEGLFSIRRRLGDLVFADLLEIVSSYEIQGYRGRIIDRVVHALRSTSNSKKLAVFTRNCRKTIETIIPELGLSISYIVAKDDVKEPKPSGEGLKKILDYFNSTPAEAIFLGDSETDIQAGKAAGIRTLFWRDAFE